MSAGSASAGSSATSASTGTSASVSSGFTSETLGSLPSFSLVLPFGLLAFSLVLPLQQAELAPVLAMPCLSP